LRFGVCRFALRISALGLPIDRDDEPIELNALWRLALEMDLVGHGGLLKT
jgi:hypothetical protein